MDRRSVRPFDFADEFPAALEKVRRDYSKVDWIPESILRRIAHVRVEIRLHQEEQQ